MWLLAFAVVQGLPAAAASPSESTQHGSGFQASTNTATVSNDVLFEDDFRGKLGTGWYWVRENRKTWRVGAGALEVRIEPGNMWGPANDAKNVLVRAAPDPGQGELEVSATVENKPTNQYEQADLVWYYDDSNMVKLGLELVDGKLSVVMGREENDKTQTIAILPMDSSSVRLRLLVSGNRIRGEFCATSAHEWRQAGECSTPAGTEEKPKLSLQFYQGLEHVEHWARVTRFRVARLR